MRVFNRRRSRERARRGGFTLIELLVVITIIGLLMGMVFPALQSAMAMLDRMRCGANIRGLAQAINTSISGDRYPTLAFRNTNKVQKVTEMTPGDSENGAYSWRVSILHNLELGALKDQIRNSSNKFALSPFDKQVVSKGSEDNDENRALSTKFVKAFTCPSFSSRDDAETTVGEVPEYDKYFNSDEDYGVAYANYFALSATSINGLYKSSSNSPSSSSGGWNGVIIDRKKGVKKSSIKDGVTKTLMLVESREKRYASWIDASTSWVVAYHPDADSQPKKDNKSGFLTGSPNGSALNVGPADESESDNKEVYFSQNSKWQGEKDWEWGPSSEHTGGIVVHSTVDGTVVNLQADGGAGSIDANVYMHLVTRNGKEGAELPE